MNPSSFLSDLTFEETTLMAIFIHVVLHSFQEQRIPQNSLWATNSTMNSLESDSAELAFYGKGSKVIPLLAWLKVYQHSDQDQWSDFWS